ncbi:N-acetyl-gamma-glutamyl-phosphate reductase [Fusibacter sp. 3D3]|uniref:N-acetyl-gamma-glutamyl-phosphate reductase n=1 Tax=Fusibacter sp. 3D3 TaxID=1048380 RepID=UPI0008530E98|nr:N-acetyl-gamma-glutamyl-phosphate reductase [Fusibacter sp. 3D3]GAU77570.1 N-acetyl-gamma-glutamyl-phosphate reductase [Fusibacter sp. 3D3]
MKNIFVDGQHGTTGLEIKRYIAKHPSLSLVEIAYEERHDINKRKTLMNASDAVVLCLPEEASVEALSLLESQKVVVIDTSTAFRTHPDWTYGLPELNAVQRALISKSFRIANPGCHASAALLALLPLQSKALLKQDMPLTLISHTGYTGGGKEMIKMYKNTKKPISAQHYALGQMHKHIPEIMKYAALTIKPTFLPILCNYPRGILLSVPLHQCNLTNGMSLMEIYNLYVSYYKSSPFAVIHEPNSTSNYLHGETSETNQFEIFFSGTDENFQIAVKIDNLGKGASGAVIQSLNLRFGFPEEMGL